jgi:hypothetical protein
MRHRKISSEKSFSLFAILSILWMSKLYSTKLRNLKSSKTVTSEILKGKIMVKLRRMETRLKSQNRKRRLPKVLVTLM